MEDYLRSPESYRVQKTLRGPVRLEGVGLHCGKKCSIRLFPAPPNHGVVFERVDLEHPVRIFAHYESVVGTELATTLGYSGDPSARVGTVEHLLAALFALGVTNVLAEVAGEEVPILDGSSAPFIEAILQVGLRVQPFSQAVLKIVKPVKVYQDGAVCELLPRNQLRLTTSIDFPHPCIGRQTFAIEVSPQLFQDEIASARTFGFVRDVERLQQKRLALGASLENALGFSETSILNEGGVRFPDECVRHKILDALGDLALLGSWIEGEFLSFRGGHSIHLALLKALEQHRSHWEFQPAQALAPEPVAFGVGDSLSTSIH